MAALTPITSPIEFDRVLAESRERPAVIFKHSPRCPVSVVAFEEFRGFIDGVRGDGAPLFTLVHVLESRALSDEIARRTGVRHESPQVIVLRAGRVIWSASHWDVTGNALEDALGEARA